MGFYPVNKITITRDYKTREIVIAWVDDMLSQREQEKRFLFDQQKEAMEFATKEFNSLAM